MNPSPRQNRLRVPAVVYRRNPTSGAPEYELLQLAAGVTGHHSVEDFVRWAALIQAQRAVKFAMDKADDKLLTQQPPSSAEAEQQETIGVDQHGQDAGSETSSAAD